MVQAVLVLEGDTARTHGCQMADDGDPTWGTGAYLRKMVKQARDRADSLQAALVKACDCTKCRWDNYAKGCPECLGSHYDEYRLRWYNMWLVKALEREGKKASSLPQLDVYFLAFSSDYLVLRLNASRSEIIYFNRFHRSQGRRKSEDTEPVLPIKVTTNNVRKTVAKAMTKEERKKKWESEGLLWMIPGPRKNAAVAERN